MWWQGERGAREGLVGNEGEGEDHAGLSGHVIVVTTRGSYSRYTMFYLCFFRFYLYLVLSIDSRDVDTYLIKCIHVICTSFQ